jgi:peptidyl-prolyl cis-trans isomerase B (cyclophilin B)
MSRTREFLARLAVVAAGLLAAGDARAAEPQPAQKASEAVVETEVGSFVIHLLPELAPSQVRYFMETARTGGYDGTTFHRILPGQVIQGGDPYSKDKTREAEYGRGGFGAVRAEISKRSFTRGTVVAARCPTDKDSSGTQFFVVLADHPSLQGHYTIFGEVVEGLTVADSISELGGDDGHPRRRVEMKVRLLD